jgi:hypothetical protein
VRSLSGKKLVAKSNTQGVTSNSLDTLMTTSFTALAQDYLVVINPFNHLSDEFSARIPYTPTTMVKELYTQVEKQLNAPGK